MKNRERATLAGLLTSLVLISWTAFPAPAHAQSWSFDAKTIALGGIGAGSGNIAASLINEQKPYRAIVIPLGLLQVLKDLDTFNPSSEKFDPIRGAEYSASPVHFVVGRAGANTQSFFVTDILNGNLSRDINDYRGFVPAGELTAGGIVSRSFGIDVAAFSSSANAERERRLAFAVSLRLMHN